MRTHVLTAEDEWFIEKGWLDALTRSPFRVGDEVVVCDKKHVMLARFYDGECSLCHSRVAVPFSREAVEPGVLRSYTGKCPSCAGEVTIFFTQQGSSFIGKCPGCGHKLSVTGAFFEKQKTEWKLESYIRKTNAVLRWILGLLTAAAFVLFLTGEAEDFVSYAKSVIWPRTQSLCSGMVRFAVSEKVNEAFLSSNRLWIEKTYFLLQRALTVPALMETGFKEVLMSFWERSVEIFVRSENLLRFLIYRTRLLFAWITEYIR